MSSLKHVQLFEQYNISEADRTTLCSLASQAQWTDFDTFCTQELKLPALSKIKLKAALIQYNANKVKAEVKYSVFAQNYKVDPDGIVDLCSDDEKDGVKRRNLVGLNPVKNEVINNNYKEERDHENQNEAQEDRTNVVDVDDLFVQDELVGMHKDNISEPEENPETSRSSGDDGEQKWTEKEAGMETQNSNVQKRLYDVTLTTDIEDDDDTLMEAMRSDSGRSDSGRNADISEDSDIQEPVQKKRRLSTRKATALLQWHNYNRHIEDGVTQYHDAMVLQLAAYRAEQKSKAKASTMLSDDIGISQENEQKTKIDALFSVHGSQSKESDAEDDHAARQMFMFGGRQYHLQEHVGGNPGSITRLELKNFMCHSNFQMKFHPKVNIICGQNGSGKSAIEAAISIVLGVTARRTGRGKKLTDLIKYGCDVAIINLFLYNGGPEAVPGYGNEIRIECKIRNTGPRGTCTYKVFDERCKAIGRGKKEVRSIVDRFNINVENPCVVLRQSAAKEFLCTTKPSDLFKFYLKASKLHDYQIELAEAQQKSEDAQQQQKQIQSSFSVVRNQYVECKQKYDMAIDSEKQREKIEHWKVAEKWMTYHCEQDAVEEYSNAMEDTQNKIEQKFQQKKELKIKILDNMAKAEELKVKIDSKSADAEMKKHQATVNRLKEKLKTLSKSKKQVSFEIKSKQKLLGRAQETVKQYEAEYARCSKTQSGARARKLANIRRVLVTYKEKLREYQEKKQSLRHKLNRTDKMKQKENILDHEKHIIFIKRQEIESLRKEVTKLNDQSRCRDELFRVKPSLTIAEIKKTLQRHHNEFSQTPIGPLGAYVQIVSNANPDERKRYVQIVQAVLGKALNSFLVATSKDQELFKQVMRRKFEVTIPCVQFAFTDRPENIHANPFQTSGAWNNDGALLRVSDLFSIKDDNAWVYNAILTLCSPERVYAHGTLKVAQSFLFRLDERQLQHVDSVMTYQEFKNNAMYRVTRSKKTVSGSPVRLTKPILQSGTDLVKEWYSQELKRISKEKKEMERNVQTLNRLLQENQRQRKQHEQELNRLENRIKYFKSTILLKQQEQRKLEAQHEEDEANNNDEIHIQMRELQNSIEDETRTVESIGKEIMFLQNTEDSLLGKIAATEKEIDDIKRSQNLVKHASDALQKQFDALIKVLRSDKATIDRIPAKIEQYEKNLTECEEQMDEGQERMKVSLKIARECGEEITREEYPRDPTNGDQVFSLKELVQVRKKAEIWLEEWRIFADPLEEIRKRLDSITPRYDQEMLRLQQCDDNVNALVRLLKNREQQYAEMKRSTREMIKREFHLIMQEQGHDGTLTIDYDKNELVMNVRTATSNGKQNSNWSRVDMKQLSGGERSFTQFAFIMALQKFAGNPLCIYDEFDVFMDSLNRCKSIQIFLKAAQSKYADRQYIFMTPNDVDPMLDSRFKNDVEVHRLEPAR